MSENPTQPRPEILSPAGDRQCFLAALAAGADAIYAGLKHFSARMEADNFGLGELAALADLAHERGARLYVPMNVLAKPGDLAAAGRLAARLARTVRPDALIVQDLGLADVARQAGFTGELHLSTLAAATHPAALAVVRDLGFTRAVLPRELSVDEIKACAAACPEGLSLEVFVHGALCYNVSGRCWWSSWLGGKSGLRGRCVQPCRRAYAFKNRQARWFSPGDLSLDVLARTLLPLPQLTGWKIEGRKKGPHYVFYTTTAYKLLRDEGHDPAARKTAVDLLEQALSRPTTHYRFLPQRPQEAVDPERPSGSGLLVGRVAGSGTGSLAISPRLPLIPGDLLRVGVEDMPGHRTVPVRQSVPKGGKLTVKLHKGEASPQGAPVFLVDRREPELMRRLADLEKDFAARQKPEPAAAPDFVPALPRPLSQRGNRVEHMSVARRHAGHTPRGHLGLWLALRQQDLPRASGGLVWWWLPPVIWPDEESQWFDAVSRHRRAGATHFVLNAPWQVSLFKGFLHEQNRPAARGQRRPRDLVLWAGPFCNTANALSLAALARLGFSGAMVSPELPGEDLLALPGQSPLPLGIVTRGQWPVGLTRAGTPARPGEPLASPKGEIFWAKPVGQNLWLYPNWGLDLAGEEAELARSGYAMFINLLENKPKSVPQAQRTSRFNWELPLL